MSERILTLLDSTESYCRRAAGKYREMFFAALCAGLVAYGFAMTNVLNNQDNISNTPGGYGAGTASGRWFLEWLAETVRAVWGTNTLPLFNGLLSIALVALSACLAASVLELQSRPFRILTGLLFVTFPSFAMTMLFIFTVGYYSFALLLTLVGVYVAKKFGLYGIVPGAVCMALALGIYQAYLPVAAALFLLILLRRGCSDTPPPARDAFLQGVRFLSVLVLGLLLYLLFLRLSLARSGVVLNDYQQINEMGSLSLAELPQMFADAYRNFFDLPFRERYAVNSTPLIRFALLCTFALSCVLFAWLELRARAEIKAKLCNLLWFALFPAAAFGIVIMCYHSNIFGRMVYGAVTAYFLPLVLLECARVQLPRAAVRLPAAALSALLLLASANYAWQSNENYMVLYYTNRQTENYFASMVSRIRSAPGYRQDLPLAFIGEDIHDSAFANNVYRRTSHRYGGYSETSNYLKAGKSYMSHYLGFQQSTASSETVEALADSVEVRAMPCYPDDGSIRVVGGCIVVKLED
ncbi:MAG: glucosyltransferase domain-containing protein [Oscillibacter sp.]|nr:glucosyltransferase domain-containing protein [Oscillibacter sp.]